MTAGQTDGPQSYEEDDVVIITSRKIASWGMMQISSLSIINQLLAEALRDVPDPDFIEVSVVKYSSKQAEQEGAPT